MSVDSETPGPRAFARMKRLLIIILALLVLALGLLYFFDQYWIHRYDSLIAREAAAHHIDPDLVWSITYE